MTDEESFEDLRAAAARLDALQGRESRIGAVIERRPGTMGGRPVFRGTRVPVEVLFENLAGGMPLAEIIDSYETLTRADCEAAILQAMRLLMDASR